MAEMPGFGVMYLVMFFWEIMYLLTSVLNQNDDAGEYKCVATNDAGSSEGIAYLTVKGEMPKCNIQSSVTATALVSFLSCFFESGYSIRLSVILYELRLTLNFRYIFE